MQATQLRNGNLKISIDATEQTELQSAYDADPDKFGSDSTLYAVFESLTCNSEYDWLGPEVCGDMTDAPILAILGEEREAKDGETADNGSGNVGTTFYYGKATRLCPVEKRWGFMDYAMRSPLDDLREQGYAIFTAPR